MMNFIPHPPFYLSEIRTADIWLLLAVGALWELVARAVFFTAKKRPAWLLQKEGELDVLQQQTNYKRKMGPSHFVETSKLERQVLAVEKEVTQMREARKARMERFEKGFLRYGNLLLAFTIFLCYYGVPIFTMDSIDSGFGDFKPAQMKPLMFPISYIGMGVRISKWGMETIDIANNSVGALVAMWSSQVTVGKLWDAFEAYVL